MTRTRDHGRDPVAARRYTLRAPLAQLPFVILETRFHAIVQGTGASSSIHADVELPSHVAMTSDLGLKLLLDGNTIVLVFEQRVSHDDLSRVAAARYVNCNETVEYPCVDVAVDRQVIRRQASDVVSCLSLLLEMPLALFSAGQADRIVPEDDADRRKIEELGTDTLYFGLQAGQATSRKWRDSMKDKHILDLLPRSPGLHLYADALRNSVVTASFRDYWRVLESAFNVRDDDLIKLLESYTPCIDLGFSKEELRHLLVIRGRASHAKSRIGLTEKKEIDDLCSANLPRLKQLAKCVILTKKSWGYPTLGVEEAQPYVRVETHPNGAIGPSEA